MKKRILIGTTNPSKTVWLKTYFAEMPAFECVTLSELGIHVDVPEEGDTPEQNALQKALAYHKATGLAVVSHDAGLYFREFSMDDPRQPGLHIRRVDGKVLDDEGMMEYYIGLARSFGPLHACYCNGFASVDEAGRWAVFNQDRPDDDRFFQSFGFLLVDQPHEKRRPGWPLDSLSKEPVSGKYWFDLPGEVVYAEPTEYKTEHRNRVNQFFAEFFQRIVCCQP